MIALFLVAVLAQVSSQSSAPPAPARDSRPAVDGTGVIRGRVVADDTGEPVRGCRVTLMTGRQPTAAPRDPREAMMQPVFARTNEEGRYEFTKLGAGSYRVSATPEMSSARYVSPNLGTPGMPFGKPFQLSDGQKLEVPEIRLQRGGVLAGRVVDEFGEPVAYVRVNPLMRMGGGEPRQVGGMMGGTDDLGRFRLFGLRAGEYFLVAEPQTFGPPGESAVRHLQTYLPSALTLAEAMPIRLGAGQEIGDLEIRLASGRTFTIRGSILTSQGQPFSRRNGQVMFVEATAGGTSGKGVELREDGTFEVRGVKPGSYSIDIRPAMMHPDDDVPADAEFGSAAVTVADSDVEGVMVVTQRGATVSGEVAFDEPRPDTSQPLYATATPTSMRIAMSPPSRAQVAPDGTFTLRGLFRPVYIRVSPPPGYHVASVTLNGQDITNTPIEFKPGKTGKVVVSLSNRLSELSGQVSNAQGRPAAAFVIAFGEDRSLWSPFATTTKYATAGEKGDYKLTGLRPGRYLVLAVPPGSRPPFMSEESHEAWEALAGQATAVTVGDQERRSLDLTLVSERDR
jgi:Carboxypeptidase regulatory-like domain